MSSLELGTSVVTSLRNHLFALAKESVAPTHGGRRTQEHSPEEEAVLERFRPFAELLVLVAAADGHIDEVERAVILGAFRALTDGRVSGAALGQLEEEIRSQCRQLDPLDALEAVCVRLSRDRRDAELALTLAAAVAMADENADPKELELISTLGSWLSISKSRLQEMLCGPAFAR